LTVTTGCVYVAVDNLRTHTMPAAIVNHYPNFRTYRLEDSESSSWIVDVDLTTGVWIVKTYPGLVPLGGTSPEARKVVRRLIDMGYQIQPLELVDGNGARDRWSIEQWRALAHDSAGTELVTRRDLRWAMGVALRSERRACRLIADIAAEGASGSSEACKMAIAIGDEIDARFTAGSAHAAQVAASDPK
jgi:hypothetical protein